jgi:predicted AlkP superfamily pyrophosphatase or phosphodiesterase
MTLPKAIMNNKAKLIFILTACLSILSIFACAQSTAKLHAKHVIIYVWDGLRPDSVTEENTPNLYKLMKDGTQFVDNHSSYPTFTMMNAASFATGDRAGKTGFFGNTLWHPGLSGVDSAGNAVDFQQPVFTEDYKILQDLNQDQLLYAKTLFQAAHEKNNSTAAIGKSGPAFMQDYLAQDFMLDEKHISPLMFAKQVQKNNFPLPKLSPNAFEPGELVLSSDNGDPTHADKLVFLQDNVTTDASDQKGSPYNLSNEYMINIFLKEIAAKQLPPLSVIWMRNPDSTEHNYGPGTANYLSALKNNDTILMKIVDQLRNHNLLDHTDIIVVSDHAQSNVSGPLDEFPLRLIENGQTGKESESGFSVSGEIRTADMLTKAGFHAFDGNGCIYNPVLSGIQKNGSPIFPTQMDKTGDICGKPNTPYISRAYKVPHDNLPQDAVIVAANGGSDYFYVPSHDKKIIEKLITFFASHKQYDAIFVDSTRYGKMKGTLSLETVGIQNPQGRSPDVVVGLAYDENAKVNGLPGIEFSDYFNMRGMHGSFSPIDVHNFMMAEGPDFRKNYVDHLPTANVDVAPTVAYLLNLQLPDTDGRVLHEALSVDKKISYTVRTDVIQSDLLEQLKIVNALNQPVLQNRFMTVLHKKTLIDGNKEYYYFDRAKGVR